MMRCFVIAYIALSIAGCSLFPKTPDEMKAWSERTYTVCSNRDSKELYHALVKQAAICHIGMSAEKVSEKKYSHYIGRDIVLKGKQGKAGELSRIETRLRQMKSIVILAEVSKTESCASEAKFYFYNGYWEGAMSDYRAWIGGDYEVCDSI
jgi:hypothetical protein